MIFSVYVDQYNANGKLVHSELVRKHTMESEARITAENIRRSIARAGNNKTHTVVIKLEA
jgi:hypothetical protein